MTQIRLHGRGGQGVVTASEIIAIAAYEDGKFAQAFPHFGVERTGAPIEAYARISDKPVRTRAHVYEPDIIIVLDASLLSSVDVASGARAKTKIVVNTAQDKEKFDFNNIEKSNIFTIDATKVALEIIGKNLANTTILGSFAAATGMVSLEGLRKAVKQKFNEKGKSIVEKNTKAIEKSYKLSE